MRGSLGWIGERLELGELSAFVLALALVANIDGAAGAVISACLHHPALTYPTLGLVQMLWERPEQVLTLADGAHALPRYGLIHAGNSSNESLSNAAWAGDWNAALVV